VFADDDGEVKALDNVKVADSVIAANAWRAGAMAAHVAAVNWRDHRNRHEAGS
jgi:hypothetical protein